MGVDFAMMQQEEILHGRSHEPVPDPYRVYASYIDHLDMWPDGPPAYLALSAVPSRIYFICAPETPFPVLEHVSLKENTAPVHTGCVLGLA